MIDAVTASADITFSIVDNKIHEPTEVLYGLLHFAPGGGNPRVILDPARVEVNILDDDEGNFLYAVGKCCNH